MKLLVFGKDCGAFPNDQGEIVEYWKISAVKPANRVQQVNDGVKITVGGTASRFSCTQSVFELLPDDLGSYPPEGVLYDLEFDDKGKIVCVDIV